MGTIQDYRKLFDIHQESVWRYAGLYPQCPERRVCLGEGLTPLEAFEGFYVKREDKNPTGSVKDRSLAFQVSAACERGEEHLVLSSSGNAAISAAAYTKEAGLRLTVFVSPRISSGKAKVLSESGVEVVVEDRPLRESLRFARRVGAGHLRQSRDEMAVVGNMSLGFELVEQLWEERNVLSLFVPVSSASCLVGLGRSFARLKHLGVISKLPCLNAVQTTFINPIAREFEAVAPREVKPGELGLAKAICAPQTPLKREALSLVRGSGGRGWVVSEEEIERGLTWLKGKGLEASPEGALALAALFRAQKLGLMEGLTGVCLLTGKGYEEVSP